MFFLTDLHTRLQLILLERGHALFNNEHDEYIRNEYDLKRGNMNFIDNYLKFTEDAESPTSFLRWSAISCISATLRDNVYLVKGMDERIYPNLYTILVARSGACRKGLPLKVAGRLLHKVKNTKIIQGRTSIQAVISELASAQTIQIPGVTSPSLLQGASGILISEELAAFLVDDKSTIPILTDLYDYHEEWDNHLKSSGTERLKNVCVSMLAASNETFLKEVYQSTAIYGGLLARTVIVLEHNRRKKNARVRINPNAIKSDDLIIHLRKMAGYRGPIVYDGPAADYFEEWYESIDDSRYESKSGVEARMHTMVEKVAVCLSAADDDFEMVIKLRHIKEAIDLCVAILQNYKFLTMSSGTARNAAPSGLILTELLRAPEHKLSKAKLLQRLLGEVDGRTIDEVVSTLTEANLITLEQERDGIGYRLTKKCLELYEAKRGK